MIVRQQLAKQGIRFKRISRVQQAVCCGSCTQKSHRIQELESKVSCLQVEVGLLKSQKQQHEQALRYLFEKVERLLKAETERHLNASQDST